jgi:MFS family permease
MFWASSISLIATAMSFAIRGDILGDLEGVHELTKTQAGSVGNAWALGFALSILFGGALCDFIGMKRVMYLAVVGHSVGCAGIIFGPSPNFSILFASVLVMGIGNGMVEAAVNPLVATIYPKEKLAKLNALHAWFPGGIVIGGVISYLMTQTMGGMSFGAFSLWQIKMAVIFIPIIAYAVMFATMKLPATERVASGVSNREMWLESVRPAFILLFFCMALTAATELGPNTWIPNIMTKAIGSGILVLVTINLVMAICRLFAGPIANAVSPVGMIFLCAVVSAIGLLALSGAHEAWSAYLGGAIFGLGACFLWPTMLAITSERFPKGGAVLLGLMGSIGNIGAFLAAPIMGRVQDFNLAKGLDEVEAGMLSLRYVIVLPIVVAVIFGAIYLWDKAHGGYKIVELDAAEGPTPTEDAEA